MPKRYFVLMATSPGEVGSWVPNIAKAIREIYLGEAKIDLYLTPCQFGSGNEKAVAESYKEIDQVFSPSETIRILSGGQKIDFNLGVIIGLGSDLIYLSMMKRKTRFPVVVYTENQKLRFPKSYLVLKKNEIGDLMQDSILRLDLLLSHSTVEKDLVIFNTGSRPNHFVHLVPYWIETILRLRTLAPELKPALSVSPFINLSEYPDIVAKASEVGIPWVQAKYLETLRFAKLLVTIPGTNTAEAMYIGTPIVMVLPTYFTKVFEFTGLIGLIGKIPILGGFIKYLVVTTLTPFKDRINFSLPNIILKKKIVPELKGRVSPDYLAEYLAVEIRNGRIIAEQKEAFSPKYPSELIGKKIILKIKNSIAI